MSGGESKSIVSIPDVFDGNAWNFKEDLFRFGAIVCVVLGICYVARECINLLKEKAKNERKTKSLQIKADYRVRMREIERNGGINRYSGAVAQDE